jgi:Flp pilus assembly protein TadD
VGLVSAAGERPPVARDDVLGGRLLGAASDGRTAIQASEVLALTDEMRVFLRDNVNPGGTEIFRLQQLTDALMGSDRFKLEYDEVTRTAAEAFHLRRGNCLSFTTLFVALARGVGLKADFQEVDIPPDWSTGRDVFVLNRHVNVIVRMGMSGTRAVDFNIGDFESTFEVEEIPDRRAIAHFFNNKGVERMQAGDVAGAVVYLRQAILDTDGDFSPAWTNLGLLYRRAGHLEHAEAAYLEAIRVDGGDYVAMSNLVSLYERQGDVASAERYRKKVDQHRLRNPHLRVKLAREAFASQDYGTAIEHLKYATRKERDDPEAFALLARCYLMTGDRERARSWADKAVLLAEDDEQRRRLETELAPVLGTAPAATDGDDLPTDRPQQEGRFAGSSRRFQTRSSSSVR